jgi:uncharacterized protein (DUF58 family)
MEQKEYKKYKQNRLQFFSRIKLKNIFPGEWDSVYTGSGIEFADIKPYEPGDDLGDLDLAELVQSGEEEMIQRATGRRMNIYIWLDLSGSMVRKEKEYFSSKADTRDTVMGLVAYSANKVYSPIGYASIKRK